MSTQPSLLTTAEVARHLRVSERTIYEMAARGDIPHTRITGKLLFPRRLIDAWIEAQTAQPQAGLPPAPPIYAGSSEPLLEWALRQAGTGLAVLSVGSTLGLDHLAEGRAVLAGCHLIDPDTGSYNIAAVRAHVPGHDIVVIGWAMRQQGIITAPGNPHGITGLVDAVSRGLVMVARGEGAGSQRLLDVTLQRLAIDATTLRMADRRADTHADLAAMIAEGTGDWGLGLASAADGLGFLPLPELECFDLVMRRRDWFLPPVQALMAFARTPAFARHAERLGGYDITPLGQVRWTA